MEVIFIMAGGGFFLGTSCAVVSMMFESLGDSLAKFGLRLMGCSWIVGVGTIFVYIVTRHAR